MQDRMIKQFMQMVQIDSESGNEARFIEYLKNEFNKMGADAKTDNYGNLIAKFESKNSRNREPVLLSCHADTVKPGVGIKPVLENGVIRSSGNTILGADDKAGIAELFEAIRQADVFPPLEIAISRQEEVGLLGVKNMDFSMISAKRGFLLDNDTLETIVIGGPSYFTIDVFVKGKAAHAGMEPEKGINAIQAAAKAISELKLGRLDNQSTANVGIINGGMIRNGVPESASFLAECRSLDHATAEKIALEMKSVIEKEINQYGASVTVSIDNLCKAVNISENSPTVETAMKALKKAGINAATTFITGFTDASIYNERGIEMAVVGIGARNEHALDEHIFVEDMEKAVIMLKEIFRLTSEN
ncbi:MAG: M20/M25/M40 family metallo-hydrolase [Ignavibacteriaceae bacterium]